MIFFTYDKTRSDTGDVLDTFNTAEEAHRHYVHLCSRYPGRIVQMGRIPCEVRREDVLRGYLRSAYQEHTPVPSGYSDYASVLRERIP